jgi:hypothetical protein
MRMAGTLVGEMAEQESPWSRPDTAIEVPGAAAAPLPPDEPRRITVHPEKGGTGTATLTRAGTVTRTLGRPPPDVLEFGGRPDDPIQRNRMLLRWFGGAAALVVLLGLVAVLIMVLGAGGGTALPDLLGKKADGPPDTRPQLVKNCPAPSAYPEPQAPPPTPPGPRTVDEETGVSYKAYGAPWEPWPMVWTGGTLRVQYKVGQHFVTEHYSGGDYHASILSASVPATVNDALVIDLKCTGRQVAADVRTQYYPQPNQVEQLEEKETRLGGRPAWFTKFRLHFNRTSLQAKSELVGLALIDVGKPAAAIVYVSIPDTHRQYDSVVDEVFDSVRST